MKNINWLRRFLENKKGISRFNSYDKAMEILEVNKLTVEEFNTMQRKIYLNDFCIRENEREQWIPVATSYVNKITIYQQDHCFDHNLIKR